MSFKYMRIHPQLQRHEDNSFLMKMTTERRSNAHVHVGHSDAFNKKVEKQTSLWSSQLSSKSFFRAGLRDFYSVLKLIEPKNLSSCVLIRAKHFKAGPTLTQKLRSQMELYKIDQKCLNSPEEDLNYDPPVCVLNKTILIFILKQTQKYFWASFLPLAS